ncbi:MAG: hypothetical protein JWP06_948 [Candidatus Saccharibacteria bacterium]|nr:hypothetical protein [Candidatus Saccharibacteria bacterium]
MENVTETNNEELDNDREELEDKEHLRMLADLTGRIMRGELPQGLDELEDANKSTEALWKEEGYGKTSSYINESGEVVMIAAKTDHDVPSTAYRFLMNGEQSDVVIPPELKSKRLMWRDHNPLISIYDLTDSEESAVPEAMRPLVAKFGRVLDFHVPDEDSEPNVPVRLNDKYYGLDDIHKEAERQYLKAEREAYDIENGAKDVSAQVKKGLFMSALKHSALQDQAYGDEIARRNSDK